MYGQPSQTTAAYQAACKVFGKQAVDASRRGRTASRKQAWMGWGPAQLDHHPRVAGWDWDPHLEAYTARTPGRFACSCGNQMDMPGHHECKCGRLYNGYVIGTGGSNHEASAEKYLVREITVRPDVIVANKQAAPSGYYGSPAYDPDDPDADFPSDHHPSVGRQPATPDDWAHRNEKNDWTSHPLPRRKRRQPA
jgi:hypothetical protein